MLPHGISSQDFDFRRLLVGQGGQSLPFLNLEAWIVHRGGGTFVKVSEEKPRRRFEPTGAIHEAANEEKAIDKTVGSPCAT